MFSDESFATEDTFYGGSYKGLLSLVRHGDQDAPSGLFWIILSAVFHLRTLQITGYFGAEIATCTTKRQLTSVELFIAATLIDIFQLLRYNTHAVIEHQVSAVDTSYHQGAKKSCLIDSLTKGPNAQTIGNVGKTSWRPQPSTQRWPFSIIHAMPIFGSTF